jgi:hypothetical protein
MIPELALMQCLVGVNTMTGIQPSLRIAAFDASGIRRWRTPLQGSPLAIDGPVTACQTSCGIVKKFIVLATRLL